MGRVWLRARSSCTPPLPVCGVGVRARVWVSAAFRLSLGVLGWMCARAPVLPVPQSLPLWGGLLVTFFFCVCLCVLGVPFPMGCCSSLGVACFGWVVPLCLSGGPAFGAFWMGGSAVSCGVDGRSGGCGPFPCPPPFPPFFLEGGLPVPPSAFPGLAHALARIQCGLSGCCWRLRSVWPCPSPMGQIGYVHVGLGAPSCRLGGCARRLRVALG